MLWLHDPHSTPHYWHGSVPLKLAASVLQHFSMVIVAA